MLVISQELLGQIHTHGEQAYPEEGAGFLDRDGWQSPKIFCPS